MIENLGDWQRTHYSNEINPELDGKEVIVMGWVRELRDLGKIKFVKLTRKASYR
jgi:nondiscriminating aspartyl-tRNA synthetase